MGKKRQTIKLYVAGDKKVGKTCLLIAYTTGKFPTEYIPTEWGSYPYDLVLDDQDITLELWDKAGGEDFERLRPLNYPKTDIFVVCFSVVSPTSFDNVKSIWLPELKHHCPRAPILLVGTKLDLRENPDVISQLKEKNQTPISYAQGLQLTNEIGASNYIECSSVSQTGLKELFAEAVRTVWSSAKSKNSLTRRCDL